MKNTIMCGDCLTLMPQIPDSSVQMIFADLPYGTTACKWDVVIPLEPLWKEFKRIIKPNGAMVFTASQPFASVLIMSNPKQFKVEWIWCKGRGTGFQIVRYRPLVSHESVLVFSPGTVKYNPQMRERDKPRLMRNKGTTRQMVVSGNKEYVGDAPLEKRYPITELVFPNNDQKNKIHPTQKPVELLKYLILTYTDEGDTVLDPVCGSGTTGVACVELNRNYLLIEKEENYCEAAKARIDARR